MTIPRNHRNAGFTLLEVLVASVLMGTAFVAVMSVVSHSLRNIDRMRPHQAAMLHARETMTELLLRDALAPEKSTGQWTDGYRWQTEIVPYETDAAKQQAASIVLFRIRVWVLWGPQNQPMSYMLETAQWAKAVSTK